ncbi:MAG TPA: trypsin-like peptidase domain-containing protein [Vicinamibacterales bacterium]|nr:trypsin-like peptidase domain-containing protein [Vicinamibacterales bacterium]
MATTSLLAQLSNEFAGIAAAAAPSVVQVHGRHRPGTGVVFAENVVLTTTRSIGRDEGLRVVRPDGSAAEAELAGWDPATNLAVLRVPDLGLSPFEPAEQPPRVGSLALAVARSWSNAVTVSAGIVSVIGGPLQTGRRRTIDQIFRTTAPMHDGFSGGAFLDSAGALAGVATAARIRGLGVVIPAGIAWKTAAAILEHGGARRGYLGVAAQQVQISAESAGGRDRGALVVAVTGGSPAARGGVIVGDVILDLDGQPVASPDDLLDILRGDRVGPPLTLRVLRGGVPADVTVTLEERPA